MVAGQNGVDAHAVAVGHMKAAHVEFLNVEHRIFASRLAVYANSLCIGITGEASGIFQEGAYALVFLHFVVHGALHLARDVHQTIVWSHGNYVAVVQPYVPCHLAVQDIIVDVAHADEVVPAVYLDVSQRSEVVRSTGHVQGMKYGRECRQGVSAWHFYLSHDVDGDCTGLS